MVMLRGGIRTRTSNMALSKLAEVVKAGKIGIKDDGVGVRVERATRATDPPDDAFIMSVICVAFVICLRREGETRAMYVDSFIF